MSQDKSIKIQTPPPDKKDLNEGKKSVTPAPPEKLPSVSPPPPPPSPQKEADVKDE